MKGIYLASYKADHPGHNLDYQDINGLRDIPGDMMTVDLSQYDYVIATPPCNWWSRANYRRDSSSYALKTKYLLPCILYKLTLLCIPFIVENVLNSKKFKEYELDKIPYVRMIKIGRHTYWTNTNVNLDDMICNERANTQHIKFKPRHEREGTKEVHDVIERFIQYIESL